MLIPSHRHTAKDLELWREYEAADMAYANRLNGSGKVERSLDVIRQFLSRGVAYCSTSWGKDSVVTAHLVHRVDRAPLGNIRVSDSRNPHCDAVRDSFLNRYSTNYFEVHCSYESVSRDFIGKDYDIATDKIWFAAIREMEKVTGSERHISGVRANESTTRRLRCMRWGENTDRTCAPLAWWTEADVFAYLTIHELPVHPNYAMLGGGRWDRSKLRTAEIGDSHGRGIGREEWEREYYGDVLRRLESR